MVRPIFVGVLLFILIVLVTGGLLIYFDIYVEIPQTVSVLQLANVIGPLALSALLVYLYALTSGIQRQQVRIDEQQTEIMKRQEQFMEATHLPVIEVDQPRDLSHGDNLLLTISNYGNGLAKNLRVRCEISIVDSPPDFEIEPSDQPLFRAKQEDIPDASVVSKSQPNNMIFPDEIDVKFQSYVYAVLGSDNVDRQPTSFEDIMTILSQEGVAQIRFYLILVYDNITGQEDSEEITGRVVDIEEDMTLSDALYRGRQTGKAGTLTVVPSSTFQKLWYRIKNRLSR